MTRYRRTVVTRKQALEKAAESLEKAEHGNISVERAGMFLNIAQLYMALAHEMGLNRGVGSIRPVPVDN
jgi:hypothetical protein